MVSLVKGVGIGTAVGAGIGALSSDDGYGTGALRGGIAGAGAGSAAHLIPRGINSAYKAAGFEAPNGRIAAYKNELSNTWGPVLKSLGDDTGKDFLKEAAKTLKPSLKIKNDSEMVVDASKNATKFYKDNQDKIQHIMQKTGPQIEAANKYMEDNPSVKALQDYTVDAGKKFYKASTPLKVGIATAAVTDAGLNSVKSHLITPMIDLGKNLKNGDFKSINWEQGGAAAFNALGAYEMGLAANDIADGNYGSAAGSLALVGAGKLAYGQGANLLKANAFLGRNGGFNLTDIPMLYRSGVAGARVKNGLANATPEQQEMIAKNLGFI